MKIFIDFDDVLLNTKEFIKNFRKIFRKNGITELVFRKYYYDYPIRRKRGSLKKYDSMEHVKRIRQELGMDTRKLEKDLKKFIKTTKKYVFSDVEQFLLNFKKKDIYLVSYAKTKFQEDKIKSSGLARHFKRIIISDKMKFSALKSIIKKDKINKKEKLYFIDDRMKQINDAKKNIPALKTFFMRRKEGRYGDKRSSYCDFEIKNLKEAAKIICICKNN